MKNLLLISIVSFSSLFSSAQLMRSEVYDFSVGNYYGLKFKANESGSTTMMTVRYQMFHILTKQLSITGDTVSYSAQRQTYLPALPDGNGGGTAPSYDMDTITFMHMELNSPYLPNYFDMPFGNSTTYFWESDTNECYNPLDTVIPSPWCFNNSGQASHFGMYINTIDSCSIEPLISEYYAYSHAGGPYGGRQCPGDPSYQNLVNELFYVVHNGVECGQFPDFFLNVEEQNQLKFDVYPNPAKDQLIVQGVYSIHSCRVFSSDGKIMNQGVKWDGNIVDVSQLDSGIYFLQMSDISGKSGIVRFVK